MVTKNSNKISIRNLRVTGLILLTFALTLLSLKAQFRFWARLFDIETAIISSTVFELLRLCSLYALLIWDGKRRFAGLFLYISIALFCGSVTVTSYHADIIEKNTQQQERKSKEIQSGMDMIKREYSGRMNEKLEKIQKDIYYIDSRIAKYPDSRYWPTRREQLAEMENDLLKEREKFLSEIPVNPELWIEKNAAVLGLKLDTLQYSRSEFSSIENAIVLTWNIDVDVAKKVVAIVFVIAIEIGIILMATMTDIHKKGGAGMTKNHSIVSYLTCMFGEDDVRTFVNKCRDRYDNEGKLPRGSELTAKLRPIRKVIVKNGFHKNDIRKLLESYDISKS